MLLGPDRRFLSSFFSCSGGFEAVFSPAQEVSEQLFLLLRRFRSSFFSCSGGFGAVFSPAQEVSKQFFLLLGRFRPYPVGKRSPRARQRPTFTGPITTDIQETITTDIQGIILFAIASEMELIGEWSIQVFI